MVPKAVIADRRLVTDTSNWLTDAILKSLGIDWPPPPVPEFGPWLRRHLLRHFEGPRDTVVITERGGPDDDWSLMVHRLKLSEDEETVECQTEVTLAPKIAAMGITVRQVS